MPKHLHQPKVAVAPSDKKSVRTAFNPESTNDQTPVWTVRQFDHEGVWGKDRIDIPDHLWDCLFEKLKQYETMTWNDILRNHKRDHAVPVNKLIKAARDRLQELRRDDIDELFRFRLTGEQRVWGIRDGRILHLLWWDPEHEICPSPLKHT